MRSLKILSLFLAASLPLVLAGPVWAGNQKEPQKNGAKPSESQGGHSTPTVTHSKEGAHPTSTPTPRNGAMNVSPGAQIHHAQPTNKNGALPARTVVKQDSPGGARSEGAQIQSVPSSGDSPSRLNHPHFYTYGAVVSNVQACLADMKYFHGPIDGDLGPRTSAGICRYQIDKGLPVTGRINPSLLHSMGLD